MLEEKEIRQICDSVIQRCKPDLALVVLLASDNALTRFANNAIHQNVTERDTTLIVRYIQGKHLGTATSNRLDQNGFDEIVRQARQNAQSSPEDPNYTGLAEPKAYAKIPSFDEKTASYSPQERGQQVAAVCRLASEKKLNAYGAFSTGCDELAVANSDGLFAYHASTNASFQTRVMSADSSGHAEQTGWKVNEISVEELGSEAIQKTEMGHEPRDIEPGVYAVILDPYATQDLLNNLDFHGMSGLDVIEGRSWMNNRIGKQVMSSTVNIWDDGLDPQGLPVPFDFEGTPKQRVEIVKDGVVVSPVYDRETAKKAGTISTGNALPPTFRGFGPLASNLFMGLGTSTLDEMIHSTERGLYITRFWYTRLVHPTDCIVTGMTRDGVYMIENGEITYPVKNLRFTQSYVAALNNVQAIGRPGRLLSANYGNLAALVPPIKVGAFQFTGITV